MSCTRLTLCMVVKNEEHNLARCLASVEGVVDEIIVVDTGSTDQTPALARAFGAHVASFDFTIVDFAAARNHSIGLATSPWVLVLDADETLAYDSREPLRALINAGGKFGHIFSRRNIPANGTRGIIDFAVRLFPKLEGIEYRGRVHETVDAAILGVGGQVCRSDLFLDHHLKAEAALCERSQFYLRVLEEEVAQEPENTERLTFLAAEYHKLERFEEATRIAETIAQLRPLDPIAHVSVGLYRLVYLGQLASAARAFQRALEVSPNCLEALTALQRIGECARWQRGKRSRLTQEPAPVAVGA